CSRLAEHECDQFSRIRVVLDQQDGPVLKGRRGPAIVALGIERLEDMVRDWQEHHERGALALSGALGGDMSAMQRDQVSDDRQAESETTLAATSGGFAPAKALEHQRQASRRNAVAGVANRDDGD